VIRGDRLHLDLILPLPRIDIVELALAARTRIRLPGLGKRLGDADDRIRFRQTEPQVVDAAPPQFRAGRPRSLQNAARAGHRHSDERPEIEVVPDAPLLVIDSGTSRSVREHEPRGTLCEHPGQTFESPGRKLGTSTGIAKDEHIPGSVEDEIANGPRGMVFRILDG
jgi:hypothetical protein